MPKHKSYLKESDLIFVPKKTQEELDAKTAKQKAKTGFDIMFEQVTKEQNQIEKEERNIQHKIENGRKKKKKASPIRDQVIKAASLFQNADEEQAVLELMEEAKKSEKMRSIADRASKIALDDIRRMHEVESMA